MKISTVLSLSLLSTGFLNVSCVYKYQPAQAQIIVNQIKAALRTVQSSKTEDRRTGKKIQFKVIGTKAWNIAIQNERCDFVLVADDFSLAPDFCSLITLVIDDRQVDFILNSSLEPDKLIEIIWVAKISSEELVYDMGFGQSYRFFSSLEEYLNEGFNGYINKLSSAIATELQ